MMESGADPRGAGDAMHHRGGLVTELATPTAKRLQKPSWRDTRLLLGILLVLLATTLGAKVIASADDRVPMYAAAQPLKPGDALSVDNLKRVDVQLGDGVEAYLPAAAPIPPNSYALREVRPGELVPRSAVGGPDQVAVQPLTVEVEANSASGLVVGSVVDVWVSERDPASTQERYLDARLALERVSVARLPSEQNRFGAGAATAAVQILVPRAEVRTVIAAADRRARLTLVPVAGSVRKSGP